LGDNRKLVLTDTDPATTYAGFRL